MGCTDFKLYSSFLSMGFLLIYCVMLCPFVGTGWKTSVFVQALNLVEYLYKKWKKYSIGLEFASVI